MIHTSGSHKLNPINPKIDTRQNGIVTEAIEVTKQLRAKEPLDDLLLEVADEMLKHVFRETGTKVVYDFLESNSNLKQEEIAEKPEVFSAGLERLLGSGALVIEKLILKNLYRKLELRFEEKKSYVFSDYVKNLRKRFER